jgi:hypothetical protein
LPVASDTAVSIGTFQATFRDVLLPFGLNLDQVHLNATEASIDQAPAQLNLSQPADITVTVLEKSLCAFLEKEGPGGLHDFEVKLDDDKVFVHASMKMIVEIRAAAVCSLRIVDGKQLWVQLEEVDVLGVGAKGLVEKQLEKINPVLDVSSFPLDIELRSVATAAGELVVKGTARPK